MTLEEIIEMARQAGICTWLKPPEDVKERLEAFAKLIAAKEREAIAQFIESTELGSLPEATAMVYARLLKSYSTAIRARGEA